MPDNTPKNTYKSPSVRRRASNANFAGTGVSENLQPINEYRNPNKDFYSPLGSEEYLSSFQPNLMSKVNLSQQLLEHYSSSQPVWEKFSNTLIRGGLMSAASMFESVGHVGDVQQWTTAVNQVEEEHGNWFNRILKDYEDAVREAFPIYVAEEEPTIMSANWWFKYGDQIIKSLGYFVPGMAMTKAAAALMKGAGIADKLISIGAPMAAAVVQNYSEHMLSATEAFAKNKDKYYAMLKENNPDALDKDLWTEAKKMASKDAEGIIAGGKFNIVLNTVEYMNLFRPLKFTRGATKRGYGELAKRVGTTSASEAWEEVNTGFLENEADRDASILIGEIDDDGSDWTKRYGNYLGTYKAITEGLSGAIGGGAMQFISHATQGNSRRAALEQLEKNEELTPKNIDDMRKQDFINNLYPSARAGVFEDIMAKLDIVENLDEETAQNLGLSEDYVAKVQEYRQIASDYEQDFQELSNKYRSDPVIAKELIDLRTKARQARKNLITAEAELKDITSGQGDDSYSDINSDNPLFKSKLAYVKAEVAQAEVQYIDKLIEDLEVGGQDRSTITNETKQELEARRNASVEEAQVHTDNASREISRAISTEFKGDEAMPEVFVKDGEIRVVADDSYKPSEDATAIKPNNIAKQESYIDKLTNYFEHRSTVDNKYANAVHQQVHNKAKYDGYDNLYNYLSESPENISEYKTRKGKEIASKIRAQDKKIRNTIRGIDNLEELDKYEKTDANGTYKNEFDAKRKDLTKEAQINEDKESNKDKIKPSKPKARKDKVEATPEEETEINEELDDESKQQAVDKLKQQVLGVLSDFDIDNIGNPNKAVKKLSNQTEDFIQGVETELNDVLVQAEELEDEQLVEEVNELLKRMFVLKSLYKLNSDSEVDLEEARQSNHDTDVPLNSEGYISDINNNEENDSDILMYSNLYAVYRDGDKYLYDPKGKLISVNDKIVEGATALAYLSKLYVNISNVKGRGKKKVTYLSKRTATNEKNPRLQPFIETPEFDINSELRFSIDSEYEANPEVETDRSYAQIAQDYAKSKSRFNMWVPIKVEAQVHGTWETVGHVHTKDWISKSVAPTISVDGNVIDNMAIQLEKITNIRNSIISALEEGNLDYIEGKVIDKSIGHPAINVRTDEKGNPILVKRNYRSFTDIGVDRMRTIDAMPKLTKAAISVGGVFKGGNQTWDIEMQFKELFDGVLWAIVETPVKGRYDALSLIVPKINGKKSVSSSIRNYLNVALRGIDAEQINEDYTKWSGDSSPLFQHDSLIPLRRYLEKFMYLEDFSIVDSTRPEIEQRFHLFVDDDTLMFGHDKEGIKYFAKINFNGGFRIFSIKQGDNKSKPISVEDFIDKFMEFAGDTRLSIKSEMLNNDEQFIVPYIRSSDKHSRFSLSPVKFMYHNYNEYVFNNTLSMWNGRNTYKGNPVYHDQPNINFTIHTDDTIKTDTEDGVTEIKPVIGDKAKVLFKKRSDIKKKSRDSRMGRVVLSHTYVQGQLFEDLENSSDAPMLKFIHGNNAELVINGTKKSTSSNVKKGVATRRELADLQTGDSRVYVVQDKKGNVAEVLVTNLGYLSYHEANVALGMKFEDSEAFKSTTKGAPYQISTVNFIKGKGKKFIYKLELVDNIVEVEKSKLLTYRYEGELGTFAIFVNDKGIVVDGAPRAKRFFGKHINEVPNVKLLDETKIEEVEEVEVTDAIDDTPNIFEDIKSVTPKFYIEEIGDPDIQSTIVGTILDLFRLNYYEPLLKQQELNEEADELGITIFQFAPKLSEIFAEIKGEFDDNTEYINSVFDIFVETNNFKALHPDIKKTLLETFKITDEAGLRNAHKYYNIITKDAVYKRLVDESITMLESYDFNVDGEVVSIYEGSIEEDVIDNSVVGENNTFEVLKYNDETRFTINPKRTSSAKFKLFLGTLPAYTMDSNGKVVEQTNVIGYSRVADIDKVYNNLVIELLDKGFSFAELVEVLEGKKDIHPEYAKIVKELKDKDNRDVRRQFVNALTNHAYRQERILTESEGNNITNVTVNKNNARYGYRSVLDSWQQNQVERTIVRHGNRGLEINPSSADALVQRYVDLLEAHPEDYTSESFLSGLLDILYDIGIVIDMPMLRHMAKHSKKIFGNVWRINVVLRRKNGMIVKDGLMVNIMRALSPKFETGTTVIETTNSNIQENNPLFTRSVKRYLTDMAKVVYEQADKVYDLTSVDGKGRLKYEAQNHTHLSTVVHEIKNPNSNLVKTLLSTSFGANNRLLNAIDNDDTNKLRELFDVTYLDTLVTDDTNIYGVERKEASPTEHNKIAIGAYQNKGYDFAKYLALTFGDSHITPMFSFIRQKLGNITITDHVELGTDILDILFKQALGEINRIQTFRKAKVKSPFDKYNVGAEVFTLFPYLNAKHMQSMVKDGLIEQKEYDSVWNSNGDLRLSVGKVNGVTTIKNIIKYYSELDIDRLAADFVRTGLIVVTDNGLLVTPGFDNTYMKGIRKDTGYKGNKAVLYAVADFYINTKLFNIDQYTIFTNDPAIYTELTDGKYDARRSLETLQKRMKIIMSPRIIGDFPKGSQYTRLTVADIEIPSIDAGKYKDILKQDSYSKMNIADAQEWVSVKEFIRVALANDKITQENFDSIMDKIENADENGMYTLSGRELKAVFQIHKPISVTNVAYPKYDVVMKQVTKSSAMPLIPQYTEPFELDEVRKFMEFNNLDRLSFESADKLGGKGIFKLFDAKGHVSPNIASLDATDYIQTLFRKDTGLQLELPTGKTEILTVSQMNKLLFSGLRRFRGFNYKGKPYNGEELERHKETIRMRLMELGSERIKKEFGIVPDNFGYTFKDLTRLKEVIIAESKRRGWSEDMVQQIEIITTETGEQAFKYPLLFTTAFDRIQSLILSIYNKATIEHKLFGKGYIQSSNAAHNPTDVITMQDLDKSVVGNVVFTEEYDIENGLNHTMIDGKKVEVAQVMVSWKFTGRDGKLLDINDYVKVVDNRKVIDYDLLPKEILEGIGARIPNQQHSSMMAFRIVGFLPSYMEDTIIVPNEIVNQMGSDFDIDKLYAYLTQYYIKDKKLYKISEENKTKLLAESTSKEETKYINARFNEENLLKTDYKDIHWSVLTHPEVAKKTLISLDNKDLVTEREYMLSDDMVDITTWTYQRDSYTAQQSGKNLIGISALYNIFNATIEKRPFTMRRKIGNKWKPSSIEVKTDEGKVLKLSTIGAENTSKYITRDEDNKIIGTEDRTSSQNISTQLSSAVDNTKLPINGYINLNEETIHTSMLISMLGTDNREGVALDYNARLITQPIVIEYLKNLAESKALSKTMQGFVIEDTVFNQIINKYAEDGELEDIPKRKKLYSPMEMRIIRDTNPDDRGKEWYISQIHLLKKYLEIARYASSVNNIMSAYMFSIRKGLGSSLFQTSENLDSHTKVNNIVNIDGYDYIYYSDDNNRSITEDGYAHDYITKEGFSIFGSLFQIATPAIQSVYSTLESIIFNGNVNDFTINTITRKDITKEITKSVFSGYNALFNLDDVAMERALLIYGYADKGIESVMSKLNRLRPKYRHKYTILDFLYGVPSKNNGIPNSIRFDSISSNNIDDIKFIRQFEAMLRSNNEELRDLAYDLVKYAYLTGGVFHGNSYTRFIPETALEALGFDKKLRAIDFSNRTREGDGTFHYPARRMIEQYIQHHPTQAFNFRELKADSTYDVNTTDREVVEFAAKFLELEYIPPYIYKYSEVYKRNFLYKALGTNENDDVVYKQIDTLGNANGHARNLSEYNLSTDYARSVVTPNMSITDKVESLVLVSDFVYSDDVIDDRINSNIRRRDIRKIANDYMDVPAIERYIPSERLVDSLSRVSYNTHYGILADIFSDFFKRTERGVFIKNNPELESFGLTDTYEGSSIVSLNMPMIIRGSDDINFGVESTLLHESAHAALDIIHYNYVNKRGDNTPAQNAIMRNIIDAFEHTKDVLLQNDELRSKYEALQVELDKPSNERNERIVNENIYLQGLYNVNEFISEILTSDKFQDLVATVPYDKEKSALERTMDLFKLIIQSIIKTITGNAVLGTALDYSINEILALTEVTIDKHTRLPSLSQEMELNTNELSQVLSQDSIFILRSDIEHFKYSNGTFYDVDSRGTFELERVYTEVNIQDIEVLYGTGGEQGLNAFANAMGYTSWNKVVSIYPELIKSMDSNDLHTVTIYKVTKGVEDEGFGNIPITTAQDSRTSFIGGIPVDVNTSRKLAGLSKETQRLVNEIDFRIEEYASTITGNTSQTDLQLFAERKQTLEKDKEYIIDRASADAMVTVGRRQLNQVASILEKKEVNFTDLRVSYNIISMWRFDSAKAFVTDDQLANEYGAYAKVIDELSGKADRLSSKFLTLLRKFTVANINEEFDASYTEEDLKELKNISALTGQARDMSMFDIPLVNLISLRLTGAAKNQVGVINKTQELITDMFAELKEDTDAWNMLGKDYNLVLQKDEKGTPNGNLIDMFTDKWYNFLKSQDISIMVAKRRYEVGEISRKEFNGLIEKVNKRWTWHTIHLDPLLILGDTERLTKYNFKSASDYANYMKQSMSEEAFEHYKQEALLKYEKYKSELAQFEVFLENEYDTQEERDIRLSLWKADNNPLEHLDILFGKKNQADVLGIYNRGAELLTRIPRIVNRKKQHMNYYEKDFLTVLGNPTLYKFYNKYVTMMKELRKMLPKDKDMLLPQNFLAKVQQDLLMDLNHMNYKEVLRHMEKRAINSITSDEISTLRDKEEFSNKERDPDTQRIKKNVPINYIKHTDGVKYSTDLELILRLFANMAINYGYKASVEDEVLLYNKLIENAAEIAKTSDGKRIFDKFKETIRYKDGAKLVKDSVKYTMDSILYDKRKSETVLGNVKLYSLNYKEQHRRKANAKYLERQRDELDTMLDNQYELRAKLDMELEELLAQRHELRRKLEAEEITQAEYRDKSRRLHNLDAETREKYDTEIITQDEYNERMKALEDEYLELEGKSLSITKFGERLMGITQLKGLGLNFTAGIANFLFGIASNINHANGRVEYNGKQYGKAFQKMLRAVFSKDKSNRKEYNLIKNFDILFDVIDTRYGKTTKTINENRFARIRDFNWYIFQTSTEYFIQSTSFLAMMMNTFIQTKDGKTISAFDAFGEDGKIREDLVTEEVAEQWNNVIDAQTNNKFTKLRNKGIQLNKKLHGNYDPNSPLYGKKTLLGRMLFQFRTWVPEGFATRFEGLRKDPYLGRDIKGRWRTYADLGLKKSISTLAKQAIYMNPDKVFKGMDDVDIENMRKNLAEFGIILALNALMVLLKWSIDDDKDDWGIDDWTAMILINQLYRAEQDVYFYINPGTFYAITHDPIPVTKTYLDVQRALWGSFRYYTEDDYRGQPPYVKWSKVIPILSQGPKVGYLATTQIDK